jgi:dihydroorotase
MKNMTNLLSKFILRSTWNPARYINREDLGHLSVGAVADLAVFNLREGEFGFVDARGRTMKGNRKLEAELTIRAGEVAWDPNGRAFPMWDEEPRRY